MTKSYHTTTRVPVDDEYAALVGKAVYVFAYYEWTIISILEFLEKGFVHRYCRGNSMTSGKVKIHFQKVINNPNTNFSKVTQHELQDYCNTFGEMIEKRNSLIHAHPCTDVNGAYILNYQTKTSKPLHDIKWPVGEVEKLIHEFDNAEITVANLLDKLRK